jgi:hypothetical protein
VKGWRKLAIGEIIEPGDCMMLSDDKLHPCVMLVGCEVSWIDDRIFRRESGASKLITELCRCAMLMRTAGLVESAAITEQVIAEHVNE